MGQRSTEWEYPRRLRVVMAHYILGELGRQRGTRELQLYLNNPGGIHRQMEPLPDRIRRLPNEARRRCTTAYFVLSERRKAQ